jgi:hypothetical protein
MRSLADTRQLCAVDRAKLSPAAGQLVNEWLEEGWLWPSSI